MQIQFVNANYLGSKLCFYEMNHDCKLNMELGHLKLK